MYERVQKVIIFGIRNGYLIKIEELFIKVEIFNYDIYIVDMFV